MTLSKVNNVDIISYTCSVRSIVIVTKHAELFKLSYCYLTDVRKQIVWYTVRVFADKTALMCADRVEVSQK